MLIFLSEIYQESFFLSFFQTAPCCRNTCLIRYLSFQTANAEARLTEKLKPFNKAIS